MFLVLSYSMIVIFNFFNDITIYDIYTTINSILFQLLYNIIIPINYKEMFILICHSIYTIFLLLCLLIYLHFEISIYIIRYYCILTIMSYVNILYDEFHTSIILLKVLLMYI